MKRFAILLGTTVAAASLAFLGVQLWAQRASLSQAFEASEFSAVRFGLSALLFLLLYPLTGLAFVRILRDLGHRISPLRSFGVLCVSQLSRYLPGNIAQHLLRGGMLIGYKLPLGSVVASLTSETLLALIAAVTLAGVALVSTYSGSGPIAPMSLLAIAVAAITLLTLLAHGPRSWLGAERRKRLRLDAFDGLRVSTATICVIAYAINYALIGIGLWILAPGGPDPSILWLCVGSFAIAWIAGFLAPGLPAGIGAREGVLVLLLSPTLGTANAIALATVHRLSTTAGDLVAFILGLAALRMCNLDTKGSDNAV